MSTDNTTKPSTTIKRLYLSRNDKKVCGVCGGLGEYFNIDSTLIRVVWVAISLITYVVPGILAYFIAALVIPSDTK